MHIIRRQPWLVRRHNILIELYVHNKPLLDYGFDYLYASVRLYGLPFEARTPQMIDAILRQIGQPSDLEEQIEFNIHRDEFYALARARLNVNRPAIDKVFAPLGQGRRIIVFIHYERMNKICTFCGGFFHNNTDCLQRTTYILNNPDEANGMREDPYGRWMTRLKSIPWDYVICQVRQVTPRLQQPSTVLTNLRAQLTAQGHRANPLPSPAHLAFSAKVLTPLLTINPHILQHAAQTQTTLPITHQPNVTTNNDIPMTYPLDSTALLVPLPNNTQQQDPMHWQQTTALSETPTIPVPITSQINDQDMVDINPSTQKINVPSQQVQINTSSQEINAMPPQIQTVTDPEEAMAEQADNQAAEEFFQVHGQTPAERARQILDRIQRVRRHTQRLPDEDQQDPISQQHQQLTVHNHVNIQQYEAEQKQRQEQRKVRQQSQLRTPVDMNQNQGHMSQYGQNIT